VRGRPKRNPGRRAEPHPTGAKRRAELWLRFVANCPEVLVGNTVWRIKRRPVWNSLAAETAALSIAEGKVWRLERPPGKRISGSFRA